MQKKKKNQSWIMGVLYGIAILVIGVFLGMTLNIGSVPDEKLTWALLYFYVWILAAYYLQIAIHEAGHGVFGLLTGYRFVSYRIGSLLFAKKEDGKIHRYRYSLAGTAGQCLMGPPEPFREDMPQLVYNMGGVLMNLIVSAVMIVIWFVLRGNYWASSPFLCIGSIGILIALVNGIPMRTAMVDNDGKNALSLGKDKAALWAFWAMLKVNEEQNYGKRLSAMPEEWFRLPEGADTSNPIITSLRINQCSRLLDQHRFEDAKEAMEECLTDENLMGLYRSFLINDWTYCALILGKDTDRIAGYLDKTQERFRKSMKNMPAVIRTEYALSLLYSKDQEKAAKIREQFDRNYETYPNKSELEGEMELLAFAEEKSLSERNDPVGDETAKCA